MKKIAIAVAATLALSATVPAFAMQMNGKLEGGYTVVNDNYANLHPDFDGSLSIKASENGGWSAETELKDLASGAKLGEYKVEFQDPLFNLMLWGNGKETTAKSDPLGFIESAAEHNGKLKARATVGPVSVDVQSPVDQVLPAEDEYDPNPHGFLFAEKAIGNSTFGISAHNEFPIEQNTVVGYGRTKFETVAVDGEIGMTAGKNVTEKNIGYGLKAVASLTPNVTGTVSYKSRPDNFDVTDNDKQGINELFAEAKYAGKNMTLVGSLTDEKDANGGNSVYDRTLAAKATVADIEAGVSRETDLTNVNDNPTHTVTLKHSRKIAPAFEVTGNLELKSDKDGGVVYEQASMFDADEDEQYFVSDGYTMVQLGGKYTGIKKLTVEPAMTYVMAKDNSYLRLGAEAGYQVAPNGKLNAEYVEDHLDGRINESKLGMGYEVKF